MNKNKIIIIGAGLKKVETELKHKGIACTEFIDFCNPLSMVGERDEHLLGMSDKTNSMPTHLDIKKNLAKMLSKDPEDFVQNYNYMPYAKNVEYSNIAEYIVICNSSLAYEIYTNGKYIYSTQPNNSFTDHIKNDKTYRKIAFPFSEGFDWKSRYDDFIDAILKEYDNRHIILIKTNCSKYYLSGTEINEFDPEYAMYRKFFREADDYFVSRTACITVDRAYNFILSEPNFDDIIPYGEFSQRCSEEIAETLENIIIGGRIPESKEEFLDISDIISLYMECSQSADKMSFSDTVAKLMKSTSALPVVSAKTKWEKNVSFLLKYKYLSDNLKAFPAQDKLYFELGNNVYITLDSKSNVPISKTVVLIQNDVNYRSVFENNFECTIEQADSLCGSLGFYIERARLGYGNRPIRLVFNSPDEFFKSLHYIDYTELLENELFLIGLNNDRFETNDYRARCDLSFFFDPNVKICVLDNGLAEQITRYIFSKRLEDYTGSTIYFDDLSYYLDYIVNGLEIDKIIKEDLSGRLFSNIFTHRLLSNFRLGDVIPDKLAESGLHEITVIVNNNEELGDAVKKCNKLCLRSIRHDFIDKIFKCGFFPLYFNYRIRPEWLMDMRPFELREYLEFPEMTGENKELENEMLGCDAVAIHIRRGDFVSLGWETDTSFYYEAIKRLLEISDYTDKKYFVFSDDIPWVKNHSSELGFDLLDNSSIFYVDHNKADDSYFDMYLISLAKVVISSGSGFARTGALFGTRCEDLIFGVKKAIEMFEMIGRKNRHDMAFIGNFRPDYENVSWLRKETQQNNKS